MSKKPRLILFSTLLFLGAYSAAWAILTPLEILEEMPPVPVTGRLQQFQQEREKFAEKYGTIFAFLLNYQQQVIVHNKRDEGTSRGLWYMNLEIEQKLWQAGLLDVEFEVDKGKGVDKFIPTLSYFNSNSAENASLYLPVCYLRQGLFGERIVLAAGKLDLSSWFDLNEVASSADTQFTSYALVNNMTIPFADNGIGAMAAFYPLHWLYLETGAATARASYTKAGLSDAFNSTLFLNEFGLSPKIKGQKGNYRFIFWLEHKRQDFLDESATKDNHFGFALSFDQKISERITLFARYGFADQKIKDIEHFWSFGGQMIEPFRGRKHDCFALGVAQSLMGGDYRNFYGPEVAPSETMCEAYYSIGIGDYWTFTPNLQIVINPDADKHADNPVVLGIRCLLVF